MWLFEKDKELHIMFGFIIAYFIFFGLILFTTLNPWVAFCVGAISSMIASAAKEIVYDKWLKKGVPNWKDFVAGCVGDFFFIVATSLLMLIGGI